MRSSSAISGRDIRMVMRARGLAMSIGVHRKPLGFPRQGLLLTFRRVCILWPRRASAPKALAPPPATVLHSTYTRRQGVRMPPHDGAGGGPDDWPGTVAADALPAAAVRAITERMEARGLTQRALGEALGVTETTVSRWLRRRAAMPLSTLARVAELLDETPGRLLDAAGSGPAGPEPADLEALAR